MVVCYGFVLCAQVPPTQPRLERPQSESGLPIGPHRRLFWVIRDDYDWPQSMWSRLSCVCRFISLTEDGPGQFTEPGGAPAVISDRSGGTEEWGSAARSVLSWGQSQALGAQAACQFVRFFGIRLDCGGEGL